MERLVNLLHLDTDRTLYKVESIVSEQRKGLCACVAKAIMLEFGQ
jgi:hypothetical protein